MLAGANANVLADEGASFRSLQSQGEDLAALASEEFILEYIEVNGAAWWEMQNREGILAKNGVESVVCTLRKEVP